MLPPKKSLHSYTTTKGVRFVTFHLAKSDYVESMKKRLLIVGLVALALWIPQSAKALTCPTPSPAKVRVKLIDPAPRVTSNKNLKQINASATGHGLVGKGKRALGITESNLETSLNMNFVGEVLQRGQSKTTCLSVSRIDARFGHKKLVVSLPREYRQGTCEFNVVYRHEMAHVDVARRSIRKYAILLRKELERAVQKNNPLNVRNMKVGSAAYQKRLNVVMSSVGKRFEAETKTLHAKIDASGSAYAADGACRGW